MQYVNDALRVLGACVFLWFLYGLFGVCCYLWESRETKQPASYKINKENFKLSINVNRPDDPEEDADDSPVSMYIPPTRAEVVGDTIQWIFGCALAAWIVYLLVTH